MEEKPKKGDDNEEKQQQQQPSFLCMNYDGKQGIKYEEGWKYVRSKIACRDGRSRNAVIIGFYSLASKAPLLQADLSFLVVPHFISAQSK